MPFADRIRGNRSELGRVVADIVVAGQVAAGNRQPFMQLAGKGNVIRRARRVVGEVAAVDDEIGTAGVDVFGEPIEILGEGRQAAGQMGVGYLGQAKIGHGCFPFSDHIGGDHRKDVMQFTI